MQVGGMQSDTNDHTYSQHSWLTFSHAHKTLSKVNLSGCLGVDSDVHFREDCQIILHVLSSFDAHMN